MGRRTVMTNPMADGNPVVRQRSDDANRNEQLGGHPDDVALSYSIVAARATIEQAKGMLMAAYPCDDATAFQLLVAESQRTNIKVRDLAARFVAENRTSGTDRRDMQAMIGAALHRAACR